MTLAAAKKKFIAQNPEMEHVSDLMSAESVVGCIFRRTTDRRTFCFAATMGVFGDEISVPSRVLNEANEKGHGIVVEAEQKFYAFKRQEISRYRRGTYLHDKVQYLRFPVALGVNIERIKHPVVQKLISEFETVPAQGSFFDPPDNIIPFKKGESHE